MTSLLLEGSLFILWVCIVYNGKIVFSLQILEKAIQFTLGGQIPLTQKTGVCALNCIIILCILCSFFSSLLRLMKSVKKKQKKSLCSPGRVFYLLAVIQLYESDEFPPKKLIDANVKKVSRTWHYWPSDVWGSVKIHPRKQWCAEHPPDLNCFPQKWSKLLKQTNWHHDQHGHWWCKISICLHDVY